MNRKAFATLIQRELWENKGSLVWTPLVVAAVLALLSFWVVIRGAYEIGTSPQVQIDGEALELTKVAAHLNSLTDEQRHDAVQTALIGLKMPFDVLMLLMLPFYCVAALYDERKDRSIYFWRSLPVSDWQTVLSKLVTATVVYPAIILASAAALQLIWMLIGTGLSWYIGVSAWSTVWAPSVLPWFWLSSYFDYLLVMLWLSPFLALYLALSAATRRPLAIAIVLPLALMLIEELATGTQYVGHWLQERFVGVFTLIWGNMRDMGDGEPAMAFTQFSSGLEVFGNGQLWFGLVLAAVLLVAAVYARRRLQDV